jgi:hypothetical protein
MFGNIAPGPPAPPESADFLKMAQQPAPIGLDSIAHRRISEILSYQSGDKVNVQRFSIEKINSYQHDPFRSALKGVDKR